jgi:radical SAM protein with 4Fe4S-binding SPASM domain
VDPKGRLQLCQLSRQHSFDLREAPFAEGWNGYFPKLRARTWQTHALCRNCALAGVCGSCPGAAELEHGDPEAVVAGFCEIAHARAFAALGDVPGHVKEATCCRGRGTLATDEAAQTHGGCTGCGHAAADPDGLIRELRIRPRAPLEPSP